MITSVLTMLFSPLLFWILFHLARMFRHTIRYDGLRSYNRGTRPPLRSA